jgi:hypothetical protein
MKASSIVPLMVDASDRKAAMSNVSRRPRLTGETACDSRAIESTPMR